MIILDTSFLFAYFVKEDGHHTKAHQKQDLLENTKASVFIPTAVLQEWMSILTYKANSSTAIKLGNEVLAEDSPIKLLKLDEAILEDVWKLFQELSPHKFSFVDCTLIYLSKSMQAQVWTSDEALEKAIQSP